MPSILAYSILIYLIVMVSILFSRGISIIYFKKPQKDSDKIIAYIYFSCILCFLIYQSIEGGIARSLGVDYHTQTDLVEEDGKYLHDTSIILNSTPNAKIAEKVIHFIILIFIMTYYASVSFFNKKNIYLEDDWTTYYDLCSSLLLIIAAFNLPNDFYYIIRAIVSILCLLSSVQYHNYKEGFIASLYLGIAIMLQPIIPFHFIKPVWITIDLFFATTFGIMFYLKKIEKI